MLSSPYLYRRHHCGFPTLGSRECVGVVPWGCPIALVRLGSEATVLRVGREPRAVAGVTTQWHKGNVAMAMAMSQWHRGTMALRGH